MTCGPHRPNACILESLDFLLAISKVINRSTFGSRWPFFSFMGFIASIVINLFILHYIAFIPITNRRFDNSRVEGTKREEINFDLIVC